MSSTSILAAASIVSSTSGEASSSTHLIVYVLMVACFVICTLRFAICILRFTWVGPLLVISAVPEILFPIAFI